MHSLETLPGCNFLVNYVSLPKFGSISAAIKTPGYTALHAQGQYLLVQRRIAEITCNNRAL